MTRLSSRNLVDSTSRHGFVTLLVCVCLVAGGCRWNWGKLKGEGFNDEMSGVGQNLRSQEKSDGEPLGTSNKALEVERNLGYR